MILDLTIPRVPLGDAVARMIAWMTTNWSGFFGAITTFFDWLVNGLTFVLVSVPIPVMIVLLVLVAWLIRSWHLALGSIVFFGLIWSMNEWVASMQTLAMVLVATLFALILAIPIGIWCARSRGASRFWRPIMDFMQTMPAFVYLIPAITFFGIGVVPGVISTLIFALPPGVRMTELGIRNVDAETVEAGESFGASPHQILRGIQMPLATPTIMAGVNQVIMLSLSMSVIAGMVGADGLGKQVTSSISTLNISLGTEAGTAVVFLAIYLDRITEALGQPDQYKASLLYQWRQARTKHGKPGLGWVARVLVPILVVALVSSFAIVDRVRQSGPVGSRGTITFGYIPSWSDGRSTAFLLKNQLEAMGYTVKLDSMNDAAVLYAGLARGDVDLYPSAWPEVTHAAYMKQYTSSIEDLGTYYDGAKLTVAVPSYSSLHSIEDLKGKGGQYNSRIVGIEPGAGLTKIVQTKVMPAYGLEGEYTLVTSSTPAMLTEVQKATDAHKDIVVTLWRPFWANGKFDMRDLEDPKGALGQPEGLHFLGKKGFTAQYPEAASYIKQLKLNDEQYNSLEDTVVNKFAEGQEPAAISDWIGKNPGVLPAIKER